ncbi:nuclear transport factor 2 family protein [Sphingobium sp. AN558]|uniref:nuclear transport factor 2 family protein n=1 Tax=Sphingobium sp. AN558 TaxID=3133442 RepID=UPI0030C63D89
MITSDYLEIQQLTHRYALHIDLFQIEKWVDVFTPDAFFDEREFGFGLYVGHDAIRAYGQSLADTVQYVTHLMANLVIENLTETSASGIVFALVEAEMKTGERERTHVRYEDDFVKVNGQWKIARKILRKTFSPERMNNAS